LRVYYVTAFVAPDDTPALTKLNAKSRTNTEGRDGLDA
jgi:hypothetical protein